MNLSRLTSEDLQPKDNHNIADNLPEILRNACYQFSDPIERELFIFSSLGVLSGCLPNYYAHYDGKWVSPHLYLYVLAPYGTGKGNMSFAKYLGDAIHKARRKHSWEAMNRYRQEMKARPKRKKGDTSDPGITAPMPPNEMLYIPADSSKSALIDALNDNGGSGIIFETEGDTLTVALKQDYAAYSDVLRKAFHHEYISLLRRQDREHKEIAEPRLAIVVSSTFDQLQTFMRSSENGLVSRFAYYLLPENKTFRDVFSDEKKQYTEYFTTLGKSIERKYNDLYTRAKPVFFHLTHEQEEAFNEYYRKEKSEAPKLGGSINRLALICYRIAMILAFFRHYDNNDDERPPEQIMCEDKDFTNALAITTVLHENAEAVNMLLPVQKHSKMPGDIVAFYTALPDVEFTTAEALKIAQQCNIISRRAERFLKKEDKFTRVGHGKYLKIK